MPESVRAVANTGEVVNALTIDVEDYFQVSAFAPYIARSTWEERPCRVEQNIDRILELLSTTGVHATFFTLGWIAERYPQMVRRIVSDGHELASHGYAHERASALEADAFFADVALAKAGYRYSSSVYPIRHDHYGSPNGSRFAHMAHTSVLEVPIATARLFRTNLPAGGGGYFRLMPYALSRWLLRRVNRCDEESAIFYFHPWEIDPGQPRVNGADAKTRFRHYVNLERTANRLRLLLQDFRWDRMDRVVFGVA